MPLPDAPFDWHRLHAAEHAAAPAVDSRRRLWIGMAGLIVVLVVVFVRAVALEITQGEAFRQLALQLQTREVDLPGVRGRILARDGSVLAGDEKVLALAVHYRYLEEPPNPRWLRLAAWRQLSRAQRRDPEQVTAAESRLRVDRRELQRRLAALAGLTNEEWSRRASQHQARVQRIAEAVNCGRQAEFERRRFGAEQEEDEAGEESASGSPSIVCVVREMLRGSMDEAPPARITVTEELAYHVMAEEVPLSLVAEIEAHPELYPGVQITESWRRRYPRGSLAAHLLGHLGPPLPDEPSADDSSGGPQLAADRVGRSGVERFYERILRGRHGRVVERIDHSGTRLSSFRQREPGVGRDLRLTLDAALQQTAEELLAASLARRGIDASSPGTAGGAILVMDVHNGAILAAASGPTFDPNLFGGGDDEQLAALLSDPARPLFDRVAQMAIPPGSVFKTLTAVALLESHTVDPYETFNCRGYLNEPDRLRCQVFVRHGHGHGEVALGDALAQSCNVYFFHHATRMGPDPLVHWGLQLGFGRLTGVDLPGEAAGRMPTPRSVGRELGRDWRTGDTQMTAIGQGRLEVTPLQVARMIAAVANGGRLVTPHVAAGLGLPQTAVASAAAEAAEDPIRVAPPRAIPDLQASTLDIVRQGLKRVVADHQGTAHGTVYLDAIEVAGKTGTAETGGLGGDHAWFAGYVPADRPRLAVVVVLEHAGSGGEAAGPVVRRLVLRMSQLGYFGLHTAGKRG